ncbi:DUF732 domain-containing protein [Mycobacterium nebraskense]|uniref:DUF732 domain-containing protein n=1 Tax=Mycobacterium nebraskense TaxID=244292 RepID=A0A0F5N827_9MYCO|nr:DUF732 domain-containing protein [Mycobacterium nebraskense]KKC02428.1 membrane protein [Mycobacterium nebraskense]KLO35311.1 membrane protein [Mycobacterium nebraskense]MBI2693576.1 DUF732 domain-containing protein [Mycobacterium nebraskense]MCV7116923.1 DUF732 domain-containing protein [Mycobacterium nebraskense]ORW24772.1 hypothetical protein AWC17_03080 [Mycobacterium nebraskense]
MQHRRFQHPSARSLAALALAGALLLAVPPNAHADVVAYLLNVTVRPGYHFADADAALVYGHGICDKISRGRSYAEVMADVKDDFNTSDEFQASYLISQAVNELCPALIWQLRKSASN